MNKRIIRVYIFHFQGIFADSLIDGNHHATIGKGIISFGWAPSVHNNFARGGGCRCNDAARGTYKGENPKPLTCLDQAIRSRRQMGPRKDNDIEYCLSMIGDVPP